MDYVGGKTKWRELCFTTQNDDVIPRDAQQQWQQKQPESPGHQQGLEVLLCTQSSGDGNGKVKGIDGTNKKQTSMGRTARIPMVETSFQSLRANDGPFSDRQQTHIDGSHVA